MGFNTIENNLLPVETFEIGENSRIKHTEGPFLKQFDTLVVLCRDQGIDWTEVGLLGCYHWNVHYFGNLSHPYCILNYRLVPLDELAQLDLDIALEENDSLGRGAHYFSSRLHYNNKLSHIIIDSIIDFLFVASKTSRITFCCTSNSSLLFSIIFFCSSLLFARFSFFFFSFKCSLRLALS